MNLSLLVLVTLLLQNSPSGGCSETELLLLSHPTFPTPEHALALEAETSANMVKCLAALARLPEARRPGQVADYRVLTALEIVGNDEALATLADIVRGSTAISPTMGLAHVYSVCSTRILAPGSVEMLMQCVLPHATSESPVAREMVAKITAACLWRDAEPSLQLLVKDPSPRVSASAERALAQLHAESSLPTTESPPSIADVSVVLDLSPREKLRLLSVNAASGSSVEIRREGLASLTVNSGTLRHGGTTIVVTATPDGVHIAFSGVTIVANDVVLQFSE